LDHISDQRSQQHIPVAYIADDSDAADGSLTHEILLIAAVSDRSVKKIELKFVGLELRARFGLQIKGIDPHSHFQA
jgi:hypothetical protein